MKKKKEEEDKRQAWNENPHMEFQIIECFPDQGNWVFLFFLNPLNIH